MISLGVCVRLFQLLPGSFIAVFYTGLALALIITGCVFCSHGGAAGSVWNESYTIKASEAGVFSGIASFFAFILRLSQ